MYNNKNLEQQYFLFGTIWRGFFMSLITAIICVLGALAIGEIISIKTKAIVPSVFITAIVF